jgi:hypothetical protein
MSAIQPISDASAASHLPAISSGSGSQASAQVHAKTVAIAAAVPVFTLPQVSEPAPQTIPESSHSVQLGVSMAAALAADNAQATSITTPLPERAVRFQPVSPLIPPYYPSHVNPNLSPAETEASTRNTLTNVKF